MRHNSSWVLAALAGLATPALAGDLGWGMPPAALDWTGQASHATPDETVRLKAGLGLMLLEANEYVYLGNYTLSHLIWQSKAPVLRGSVAVNVGHGLFVEAEGSVAAYGTSYMEDYDWLAGDDTPANWTHRSQHPDTHIDHYWTGSLAVGYELARADDAVVRLHGGLKYTDVQWSAYGGSYVYSTGGFRDDAGAFPDGAPGITYRQQLPEAFIGVDGDQYYGNFRVGGLLRGGLTFAAVATDDHWMRDLRFYDYLNVAPTLALGADVGFALGPMAELVMAARYDQIFEQRGETRTYDTTTGNLAGISPDTGAGDLRSFELTAGIRGNF